MEIKSHDGDEKKTKENFISLENSLGTLLALNPIHIHMRGTFLNCESDDFSIQVD